METMFQYINETPDQCLENINSSKELTKKIVDAFLEKDYKRIEIIACGSSYNATMTAKNYIERILKLKVEVITPLTFTNYDNLIDDETFYCGIGQSGRSVNTNEAMRKVQDNHQKVTGVTGNVESVMKNNADSISYWGVGIEKVGFVTKGYSTAALFWMLFAVEAAARKNIITDDEYNYHKDQFMQMVEAMRKAIPTIDSWYKKNEKELYDEIDRTFIVGCGPSYGTALEGALKMEETMGKSATAFELEEFLHGPYIELNGNKTVFIIDGDGKIGERARQIYNNLNVLTERLYLITNKQNDDAKTLVLDHNLDDYYATLVNVIAFQTIAAYGNKKWVNPLQETRLAFIDKLDYKTPKTGNEVGL